MSLAGISQEKDLQSLSTTEYMALAEAAEQLADSQIGAHTIDSVLRENLWDMIVTEFACEPDDDDVGEAGGIVILDNVDMFNLGHNREEAMNYLRDMVYGTYLALIAAVSGGDEAIDSLANAGLIAYCDADHSAGETISVGLRVVKSSYSPLGMASSLKIDVRTLAIVEDSGGAAMGEKRRSDPLVVLDGRLK